MELTRYTAENVILPDGTEVSWKEAPAGRYFLADLGQEPWDIALGRVSSDLQDTLHQQVDDACRLACKDGRVISAIYLEPGFSAFKLSFSQRAVLTQLLEDIEAGRIRTIYVYKRDRVSRHEEEWLYFIRFCEKHKAEIVFTCPGAHSGEFDHSVRRKSTTVPTHGDHFGGGQMTLGAKRRSGGFLSP